jgi:hypothetical protein
MTWEDRMIKLQGMTETIGLDEEFEALLSTDNATSEDPVIHGMTEIMSFHAPLSEEKTRPYARAVLGTSVRRESRNVGTLGRANTLWSMIVAGAAFGFVTAFRGRRN